MTSEQSDAILAEIADALGGLQERQAAMHAALAVLERRLPALDGAAIYLHDNGVLNLDAHVGAAGRRTLIPIGHGICGEAVAACENIIHNDLGEPTGEPHAEAALLMREPEGNAIVGLLHVLYRTALDDNERALLAAVANRLAPSLRGETTL